LELPILASVVYDGDSNRVAETVGGVTTQYLIDDRNPRRMYPSSLLTLYHSVDSEPGYLVWRSMESWWRRRFNTKPRRLRTAYGLSSYCSSNAVKTGLTQVMDEVANGAVTKTYAYGLQRISENQLIGGAWTPSFYGYDGHGNVR
jgi:hypothetical protein